MNRRERAVLLLLSAAFLVGAGVFHFRRAGIRRQAAMSPVAVIQDASTATFSDSAAVRPPIDLNRATPRELDGLPGIGPVLAARIVEYRQRRGGFSSVGELRSVSGIGEKKYSALKGLVIAGPVGVAVDSGR